MFDTTSVIANVWAEAIRKEDKKLGQVPNLSNLIDVVNQILEGGE